MTVLSFKDVREDLVKDFISDFKWPWQAMDEATYGQRRGEVVLLAAATGLGKSTFVLNTVARQAIEQGLKVLVISFEETPSLTFRKVAGWKLKKRIDLPHHGVSHSRILQSEVPNLYVWDAGSTADWFEMLPNLQQACDKYKFDIVVVDNVSNLAASVKFSKKNLAEILGDITISIKSFAIKHKIMLYLIAHVGRNKNKGDFDRGVELSLSDIRSSEGIGQHSDFVFGLERDALHKDKERRSYVVLRCLKDRAYGQARGEEFYFKYVHESGCFEETEQLQVDIELDGLAQELYTKCVVPYAEYLEAKKETPDIKPPTPIFSMSIPLGNYFLYISNVCRPTITFDASYIYNGHKSFSKFAEIVRDNDIELKWFMVAKDLFHRRLILYFDTFEHFQRSLLGLVKAFKTEELITKDENQSTKCKLVNTGRSIEITEDVLPGYVKSRTNSYDTDIS